MHRRESAGHAARPHDPPAGRGRGAGQGRREHRSQDIPSAQVVREKGFLGVVAEKEWDAVQRSAEAEGGMVGREAAVPGPERRSTTTSARHRYASARSTARKRATSTPHSRPRPRDRRGRVRMAVPVACPHGPGLRRGRDQGRQCHLLDRLAEAAFRRRRRCATLDLPLEKVHAIWVMGPGSYGRNDAGDAAMDAAVLAKAVGNRCACNTCATQAPAGIRKGPASIHRARAAHRRFRQCHRLRVHQQRLLAHRREHERRQAVGHAGGHTYVTSPLKSGDGFGVPAESYEFANKRLAWETIPPLLDRGSPLRTSHLRDPVGPQIHFASEVVHG